MYLLKEIPALLRPWSSTSAAAGRTLDFRSFIVLLCRPDPNLSIEQVNARYVFAQKKTPHDDEC